MLNVSSRPPATNEGISDFDANFPILVREYTDARTRLLRFLNNYPERRAALLALGNRGETLSSRDR